LHAAGDDTDGILADSQDRETMSVSLVIVLSATAGNCPDPEYAGVHVTDKRNKVDVDAKVLRPSN